MEYTLKTVFTNENLYDAYRKCRRGVGWKHSTQAYKANACVNLRKTQKALLAGVWRSRGFQEFDIMDRGKKRHIKSVHISERVVQRCLCDHALVPLLGRSLIPDNAASRKGRGVDYAVKRLTVHLRQHYAKHGREGYILLFDFHDFFGSICHEAVFGLLDRKIEDPGLRALTKHLVSMFGDRGLGLGSQVSQILALAVPDRMDHVIKEELHIHGYGRYMDDGYLIHTDKGYLLECLERIREEAARFGVTINEKKTRIVPLSRGFRFLKLRWMLTDSGRVVRRLSRENITRARRRLKKLAEKLPPEDLRTSYASWQGYAKRCQSWHARENMKEVFDQCMQRSREKNIPWTTS